MHEFACVDEASFLRAGRPGTGTPEPAGMRPAQVMSLLEDLADRPLVGMDCVEVSPPNDHAGLTANAAAALVWTYLSGRLAARMQPTSP